jgi:hypothetical protein
VDIGHDADVPESRITAAFNAAKAAGVDESKLHEFAYLSEEMVNRRQFRGLTDAGLQGEVARLQTRQSAGKLSDAEDRRLDQARKALGDRDQAKGEALGTLWKSGPEGQAQALQQLRAMPEDSTSPPAEQPLTREPVTSPKVVPTYSEPLTELREYLGLDRWENEGGANAKIPATEAGTNGNSWAWPSSSESGSTTRNELIERTAHALSAWPGWETDDSHLFTSTHTSESKGQETWDAFTVSAQGESRPSFREFPNDLTIRETSQRGAEHQESFSTIQAGTTGKVAYDGWTEFDPDWDHPDLKDYPANGMPSFNVTPGNPSLPLYRYVHVNHDDPEIDRLMEEGSHEEALHRMLPHIGGDRDPDWAGHSLNNLGIHWTHDPSLPRFMSQEDSHGGGSHGVILQADHPGVEHTMSWDDPRDAKLMHATVFGGPDAGVHPEVAIRPNAPMNVNAAYLYDDQDRTHKVPLRWGHFANRSPDGTKIAGPHKLWWKPGQFGRGLISPDNVVHTWPEDEMTHAQRLMALGVNHMDTKNWRRFSINPNRTTGTFGDPEEITLLESVGLKPSISPYVYNPVTKKAEPNPNYQKNGSHINGTDGWDSRFSAYPEGLYHVAPTSERARILQHGLQVSDPHMNPRWEYQLAEMNQPKGIYATENPKHIDDWKDYGWQPFEPDKNASDEEWEEYENLGAQLPPEDYTEHWDTWHIPAEQIKHAIPDPVVPRAWAIQHPVFPTLHEPAERSVKYPSEHYHPDQEPADQVTNYWERLNLKENQEKGNPWGIGLPNRIIGSHRWAPKLAAYPAFDPQEHFYHIAPTTERARIQTHGLKAGDPTFRNPWLKDMGIAQNHPGVYMADDPDRAMTLHDLHDEFKQPYDVWRATPRGMIYLDPDYDTGHHYFTPDDVEPHRLQLHTPWENNQLHNREGWDERQFQELSDRGDALMDAHHEMRNIDPAWNIGKPTFAAMPDKNPDENPPVQVPIQNPDKFFTSETQHERRKKNWIEWLWKRSTADPDWVNQWVAKNGPYMYHGTTQEAVPKIVDEGLFPHDHLGTNENIWKCPACNHTQTTEPTNKDNMGLAACPRCGDDYLKEQPTHSNSEYAGGYWEPREGHVYLGTKEYSNNYAMKRNGALVRVDLRSSTHRTS